MTKLKRTVKKLLDVSWKVELFCKTMPPCWKSFCDCDRFVTTRACALLRSSIRKVRRSFLLQSVSQLLYSLDYPSPIDCYAPTWLYQFAFLNYSKDELPLGVLISEHGCLLSADPKNVPPPELLEKLLSIIKGGADFDCAICLNQPTNAVITPCAHVFCQRCIEKSLLRIKEQCPMCRSNLSASELMAAPKEEGVEEDAAGEEGSSKSSAKVDALIKLLAEAREKDPTEKSVIFSQFSRMLNCLEGPLLDAGFRFVRLDGSMSSKKRQTALTTFQSKEPGCPTIFLLSLKAAGVGLNLVSASRVYMVDPWWNPAVEEQAMDRVHRLGQTRDVTVVRLIVADSIEDRILELQERKRQLAAFAFEKRSAEKERRMRIQDVQLLMRL